MPLVTDLDKCLIAERIIGKELNTPNFTRLTGVDGDYGKARHLYVYLCHVVLNIEFTKINKTMPVYGYKKTVYQVFRRAWEKRKENEIAADLHYLKTEIEKEVGKPPVRRRFIQLCLF